MPLFSVIIPTYNRLPLLQKSVASVWAQTCADYELIVVDDGSTDGTWDWLQSNSRRISSFRQANAGPGAARNLGAQQAKGDYLAFLDSDDVWFPWTLTTAQQVIRSSSRPAVIQTSFVSGTVTGEGRTESPNVLRFSEYPSVFAYAQQKYVAGAGATILSMKAWSRTSGFPSGRIVGEDIHLLFQLGLTGPVALIESPPMFRYQRHDSNTTRSSTAWFQGARCLLRSETQGEFPGAKNERRMRRRWLAQDIAYRSCECLKSAGGRRLFIKLYLESFPLQLEARNFNYLLKSPAYLVLSIIGYWPRPHRS